jgi:carbonic anhydrase/acetyltransferase-like protein (isoleucine patch superfamily)
MAISCDTAFVFTPTGSVHIEGVCQYTHLGRTTVVADQNVIPQPDGSLLITNLSVYTAANGDELHGAAVGTGNFTGPTSVVFTGVETYEGGTGRFAGATGSVPFSGGAEFDTLTTGTGHFAGSGGVISY